MRHEKDPIELRLKALALRGRGPCTGKGDPCPSDETFGAFMDGFITAAEGEALKAHIAQCPDCHLAYSAWQEMDQAKEPVVPPELVEAARARIKVPLTRVVGRLLKKAIEILNPGEVMVMPKLTPAQEAVRRSGAKHPPDQYEIVEIEPGIPVLKSLRIQHLEDTGTVKISLFPSPDLQQEDLGKYRIELYCGPKLIQSWPLSGSGTALNPIEKGEYRVTVLEVISGGDDGPALSPLGYLDLDLQ